MGFVIKAEPDEGGDSHRADLFKRIAGLVAYVTRCVQPVSDGFVERKERSRHFVERPGGYDLMRRGKEQTFRVLRIRRTRIEQHRAGLTEERRKVRTDRKSTR